MLPGAWEVKHSLSRGIKRNGRGDSSAWAALDSDNLVWSHLLWCQYGLILTCCCHLVPRLLLHASFAHPLSAVTRFHSKTIIWAKPGKEGGRILLRSAGERVLLKKTLCRFIEKTLKLSRCADASSKVAFIKIFSKVVDWNCVIIDTWLYSAEKCNSIQKQSSYCPQIRYKKKNKVHNLS